MSVNARVAVVAFDAADIEALTDFWTKLTGWEVTGRDDDWITVRTGAGQDVAFQKAPDHVPPQWPGQEHPQQFHLDLLVDGIEEAAQRAESLGATRLGAGATWITLADPAGHPFDLCQRDGQGSATGLFAVTIDAPDASALAHFYADVLQAEVTYDGPEGAMLGTEPLGVMFQQIEGYTAPQWPDPAHPQQAHLDIAVDDLDDGEARVLELGARRLDQGQWTWRVFADPAGHPFCLVTS